MKWHLLADSGAAAPQRQQSEPEHRGRHPEESVRQTVGHVEVGGAEQQSGGRAVAPHCAPHQRVERARRLHTFYRDDNALRDAHIAVCTTALCSACIMATAGEADTFASHEVRHTCHGTSVSCRQSAST